MNDYLEHRFYTCKHGACKYHWSANETDLLQLILNGKVLLDYWAFLLVKRFEPLNTNLTYFRIYRIAKAFTFPLDSDLNIDKNRSTHSAVHPLLAVSLKIVPPQRGVVFREEQSILVEWENKQP